jgi:outer membrane lipoprotein LolB
MHCTNIQLAGQARKSDSLTVRRRSRSTLLRNSLAGRSLPAAASRKLLWLAGAVALAGCRSLPVQHPLEQPWPARKAELQAQAHFELKGRVAVAVGGEGFQARLRWVQDGAQTQLSLAGPLGAGGVQVTSDDSHVSITTSRGEHLDDQAAREELTARLGFEPPFTSLRYWMLGVPDPRSPATETLDPQQQLLRLEQGGWQIDYTAYMPVNSQSLPAKVTLQNADVRVRLVVDSWGST